MKHPQLSEEDIAFVDELVRNCGLLAAEMRHGVAVHTKSGPNDLVTDADLALSRRIISALSQRFPKDLIVSEEDKHEHKEEGAHPKHSRVWLIDPIDGTENYVKEDGQYSCMVGLLIDHQPYYGWIYQPSRRTLFSGGADFGAWKTVDGHQAKQYTEIKPLHRGEELRLMVGWGDRKRHPWVAHLPNVRVVPSQSLGLKIMKILEDEADLFISLTGRVKLWDTAAPAAIALGSRLDVGTAEGEMLPFPLPKIQHGSSVVIGRPGSIEWALKYVDGHASEAVPRAGT